VTPLIELSRLLDQIEQAGTSLMELARVGRPQESWTLYPDEYGIFDRKRHSQFYYHAHAGADHEAGHFHTVRLFPDHTVHLVAISMDHSGRPQALFTVNLWAIGDVYASPEHLKRYTRQYRLEARKGDARLVRFINLVFRAFLGEIEALQDEKERAIQRYRAAHGGAAPFEDRSVEILSRVAIDVPRHCDDFAFREEIRR
jgi:hypothetical protein